MIDYKNLFHSLETTDLADLGGALTDAIASGLSTQRYGDLAGWLHALNNLPRLHAQQVDLHKEVSIGHRNELTDSQFEQLTEQFRALIPWRKGPYKIFGLDIDTEWRSDWKWQRVLPDLDSLQDRTILDVGCGNGYHCLRMYGEGAERVIGIDPSPRFVIQFYMLKHFLGDIAVDVLPVPLEALPSNLEAFDTTFSMGVLYHRRSPMDHIRELKGTLRPGGQLVLETLVIEGELGATLVPEGRYAMMNNVWFIPSPNTLMSWLRKAGFGDIKLVDTNITSLEEQRSTPWMQFHSLQDFLDPNDHSKTAEGHPAPMRAVITARKPDIR